jgi:hypothetical protein
VLSPAIAEAAEAEHVRGKDIHGTLHSVCRGWAGWNALVHVGWRSPDCSVDPYSISPAHELRDTLKGSWKEQNGMPVLRSCGAG